jgi:CysZ protein
MAEATRDEGSRRPGLVRRAFAGAWHVPAGFAFLLRRPGLWLLAALPVLLAVGLMALGAVGGMYLVPDAESLLAPAPGRAPEWIELPVSLLLWTAAVGGGIFLGLGLALLLTAPLLDLLSRRVEARVRGQLGDRGRGLRFELLQSLRGAVYFLVAAPGVFLLGLIPVVGPFLSLLWGGHAMAYQMTDPALTRRGLAFADKRRWHRLWRAESEGFGLAGMIGLLVPFANLLLGPALVAGGTLLVLDLEEVLAPPGPPVPGAVDDLADTRSGPGAAAGERGGLRRPPVP